MDGRHDFDFLIGAWRVRHRRLKQRLAGCTDWDEMAGTATTQSLLGGLCIVEEHWIDAPALSGVAVRTYDVARALWSIRWVGSDGLLGAPVHGGFNGEAVGRFEGDDTHDGCPVKVRFRWTRKGPDTARWEQAFSGDDGITWEVNWAMDFTRAC